MARILARTEAEVVDAVRAARKKKSTLEIVGAGSKRGLGRPMECDDILDLSQLSGIVAYEPDELTITVKAGTKIAEIEDAIAPKNQRVGFAPADWGLLYGAAPNSATIGGALSADVSGSLALRHGRARNHLLGFRAVNGFGEAYKAGGRVVKNVTGFDLPKLMCGAMGTLGALTEVTLRLYPKQPFSAGFVVKAEPQEGLSLLRAVWASPLEATGLAYLPSKAADALPGRGSAGALIRLEGTRVMLDEKRSALRTLFAGRTLEEIADGDGLWSMLGAGAAFLNHGLDVWRVAVAPSQCLALVDALNPLLWVADWAGSLLWAGFERSDASIHEIARRFDAQAILLRASEKTRANVSPFPPQSETHAALAGAVKAAFDPLHIFNPGRMGEEA